MPSPYPMRTSCWTHLTPSTTALPSRRSPSPSLFSSSAPSGLSPVSSWPTTESAVTEPMGFSLCYWDAYCSFPDSITQGLLIMHTRGTKASPSPTSPQSRLVYPE
ncbi:hypothetical protein GQ457_10G005830 [Hibiscus cannabinus]